MSNLRKVLRAMNHCEEWRDIVGGAAMLQGVDATEELITKVTWEVVDLIEVDADTLVVDVSGVDDDAVMDAVALCAPQTPPETVTNPQP